MFHIRSASPGDFIETAGRKVGQPGRCSAYFDGAIFLDGEWIAGFDSIQEFISKQVDRDDAFAIPDVIH